MSTIFWVLVFAAQDLWFLRSVYTASQQPDQSPLVRQHVRDGYMLLGCMVVGQTAILIAARGAP